MTYIGLDLGTSSIKGLLIDENQRVIAQASCDLHVQRPHPLWSEQDPASWVGGALKVFTELKAKAPAAYKATKAIGLSGQMHGATLLDNNNKLLRPCILWNDGRSDLECQELEAKVPNSRAITGNIAMPGFTAPKLLWLKKQEPEIFKQIHKVLLPKAYLRFILTGEMAEDMSDASGTLWLDVAKRQCSSEMLAATGLNENHMPCLVEGTTHTGCVTLDLGFDTPPIMAGGAGDNAAGAIGLGAINKGDAFLSLGTSGVLWRTTDKFQPQPDLAVHAFCHAIPNTWHQMSVHLSAASCLSWWGG